MKILIAPNAFKGTLTAKEACGIIEKVLIKKGPFAEILIQPIADGGDGTCNLLVDSLGLKKIIFPTLNPIGKPTIGFFGFDSISKKAYLDVSTASGISLLDKSEQKPDLTSTFGTGLIIQKAIETGAEEIVLGLGGSSTIDLGLGILAALGVYFLDSNGRELIPFTPDFLAKIHHIQYSPKIPKIRFSLLCDVRNSFFGEKGAIPVFGFQKGLKNSGAEPFEKNCRRVVDLFLKKTGKEWVDLEGFGAAGGIALGLSFVFPTQIEFGANRFFELVEMESKIEEVDWIITGEGRYDSQSTQGKASFELLRLAKQKGKKIVLITSGNDGNDAEFDRIIRLPELDFSAKDLSQQAKLTLELSLGQSLDINPLVD